MRLNDWQLALEGYLLGADAQPNTALQASLVGSPTLSVEQGLTIYHHAYRARLLGVMLEDFPAVHYWLGDEEFALLVQAYLDAHPSRDFSLRWFGERFADFIHQQLSPQQSAPLVELARLEWAFTLAFDALPGAPLTVPQMASLAVEEWPTLQVQLLPCVQQLRLEYNSLALWQAAKAEGDFPPSSRLAQPMLCLLWRHELISRYRSVADDEACALLGMCVTGWNFAQLCEQLAEHGEQAPAKAAGWLKQWLSEGLLQRVQAQPE
ncbi:MAG: DNA-binding domain-containing protein [Pseudomonas sp.]|uniref:HvfC/BufC N-terminal domain-containing protein n=1 Tax=Pseudomonas sp. TaxID=306 RepID=UPI002734442E|nr:DNA-binding domain-containing protein [Pseudomonas sp.]MDP3847023.1 DNA-binding domain-containing protein [Pseudomonas sp.]